MPYWSIYCLYCHGYIADALLEMCPSHKANQPGFSPLDVQSTRSSPGVPLL